MANGEFHQPAAAFTSFNSVTTAETGGRVKEYLLRILNASPCQNHYGDDNFEYGMGVTIKIGGSTTTTEFSWQSEDRLSY